MLGLDTLDVGIGMALMFLFVSLVCSAIREFIEAMMQARASTLERGIKELFGEGPVREEIDADVGERFETWIAAVGARAKYLFTTLIAFKWPLPVAGKPAPLTEKFYSHPVVNALYSGAYQDARPWMRRNRLPAYIPAENFARATLEIARFYADYDPHPDVTIERLRYWSRNRPAGDPDGTNAFKKALQTALDIANNDLAKTEKALQDWYNSTMDRVSGWYTRHTQVWLFFLGLGCAVVMNVDAITVMKSLSTDKTLRDKVVGAAGDYLAGCGSNSGPAVCPSAAASPSASAVEPTAADTSADAAATASAQASDDPSDAATNATAGAAEAAAQASQQAADASKEAVDNAKKKFQQIQNAASQMNDVAWPIGWDDNWLPAPQQRLYVAEHPSLRVNASVPNLRPPGFPHGILGWIAWPFLIVGWFFRSLAWLLANRPLVVAGWLVTGFGVTFGASFWFDTLNKFMIVRSTVKPDEKSPKEGSKD